MHRVVSIRFPLLPLSVPESHTIKSLIRISKRAFCRCTKMLEHICFCEKIPAALLPQIFILLIYKNVYPNQPRAIHTCICVSDFSSIILFKFSFRFIWSRKLQYAIWLLEAPPAQSLRTRRIRMHPRSSTPCALRSSRTPSRTGFSVIKCFFVLRSLGAFISGILCSAEQPTAVARSRGASCVWARLTLHFRSLAGSAEASCSHFAEQSQTE